VAGEHGAAGPTGPAEPAQVSADPRSRRRRTLHPSQRALPIPRIPPGQYGLDGGAQLATSMAAWLHQLTAITAGEDILAGHGVRGGKAMIATLRWRLIAIPAATPAT
jgi:hypothetical protein